MNIGSAKPSLEERKRVAHHCIDIVDPDHAFTAGEYCGCARSACEGIRDRGKLPLFAGGAGLYIDSFFYGLSDIPVTDPAVREGLYAEIESRGLAELYDELRRVDPPFAGRIHANDRQRILRGLEVFRSTGTPLSGFFVGREKGAASGDTLFIGIEDDKEDLGRRIDRRVDRMIEEGLVDEVEALRSRGYTPSFKSMKSIGYAEIHGFLDGASSFEDAVDHIKRETKKYAKRQMTWFRKNGRISWHRASNPGAARDAILRWFDAR